MIMTFDFVMQAWGNSKLMLELQNSMKQDSKNEVHTPYHRIIFYPDIQKIDIFPLSEKSPFHWKIISKRITYSALDKMLNKDFEHFADGDIVNI